jgi:hypothetical protein
MHSSVVSLQNRGVAARRQKRGDYTSAAEPLSIRDAITIMAGN